MKKILALALALVMLCAACAAAEGGEPLFATVGDAIAAGAGEAIHGCDGKYYAVALEMDGKYIRAVADLDEKETALGEAISAADNADDIEAAFAAYDEYVATLPITYTEEFTVSPKAQAELDALAGKSIGELEEDGYQFFSAGPEGLEGKVVFVMDCGVYRYEFVINEDEQAYEKAQEEDLFDGLTVKTGTCIGLSNNAAETRFHADGTVDPEENPFAVFNEIAEIIAGAAGEDGKLDKEALIAALTEKFPGAEEQIRLAIELYELMGPESLQGIEGLEGMEGLVDPEGSGAPETPAE